MTPLAIAHRAGNALPALQAAIELGTDVLELDVHSHQGRLEVRHLKTMGPLPFLWDRWELVPTSVRQLRFEELLAAADPDVVLMVDLKGAGDVGTVAARALHEQAPGREVVMTWPVNDTASLDGLLAMGVSGIISDELAVLQTLLERRPSS